MTKKTIKKIGCAVLVAGLLMATFGACGSSNLKMASADQNGEYYKVANELAKDLETDADIQAEVLETTGSAGNLRLISGGYVQLAVVQSDVAAHAYQIASDSEKGYSAVGALYTEVCHIIVRDNSDIYSVADLVGRKVSIGASESGTESSAKEILLAYGITEDNAILQNLNYSSAAAALTYGDIDALFCTGNVGMTVLKTLSEQTPIRLIPVTAEDLDRMNQTMDVYHISLIPAGTYPGQTEDVPAISVVAMLVASDSLNDNTVKKVTESLLNRRTEFVQTAYLETDQESSFIVSNIPIPFHQGAVDCYEEKGIH